jgi:carnitine-CoA ligase
VDTETLENIVNEYQNVAALLERRTRDHPDRPLFKWQACVLTYREIDSEANRVARTLSRLGLGEGDRIAIMMLNSPEWIAVWFGALKVGAAIVPVNTAYKGEGLGYQLADSGASVLVINDEFVPRLTAIREDLGIAKIFVSGDAAARQTGLPLEPLSALFDACDTPVASSNRRPQDPAAILYTSGTTGAPKGCVLPHGQYLAAAFLHANKCGYTADTTIYTCLPLFHINAQNYTILSAISAGATIAMDARFSASNFWDRLVETGATAFNIIGSMAVSLWRQPSAPAEQRHHATLAFGVPVPLDIWPEWEERFGCRVIYAYGMTENALPAIFAGADAPALPHLRGSAGKASPTSEIAIVDGQGRPVEPGIVGEIVTRPTIPWTMMTEYLDKPDATSEAFRDGWFHTGDLGYLDSDGYLFFVDRKKDALRRKGEMVSSWEVEAAISKFSPVAECAIVGVPSEMGEDEIMAVIVVKDGETLDPRMLLAFCEDRIATFQIPRYIRTVASLPRTQTQRVEKYKLRRDGVTADTWDAVSSGAAV